MFLSHHPDVVGTVEGDDGVVGSKFGVADVKGMVGLGKFSGDEPSNFFVNSSAFGKPGQVSSFGVDEFAGCPVGWFLKVDMNTICVVRQEPFVRNIQIDKVGVDQLGNFYNEMKQLLDYRTFYADKKNMTVSLVR